MSIFSRALTICTAAIIGLSAIGCDSGGLGGANPFAATAGASYTSYSAAAPSQLTWELGFLGTPSGFSPPVFSKFIGDKSQPNSNQSFVADASEVGEVGCKYLNERNTPNAYYLRIDQRYRVDFEDTDQYFMIEFKCTPPPVDVAFTYDNEEGVFVSASDNDGSDTYWAICESNGTRADGNIGCSF